MKHVIYKLPWTHGIQDSKLKIVYRIMYLILIDLKKKL